MVWSWKILSLGRWCDPETISSWECWRFPEVWSHWNHPSLKCLLPNLLDSVSGVHFLYQWLSVQGGEKYWSYFFKLRNQTYGKYVYSYYDQVSASEYIYIHLLAPYEIVAVLNTLRLMWELSWTFHSCIFTSLDLPLIFKSQPSMKASWNINMCTQM